MRVLITGASGFVGQNILEHFKDQIEIEIISKKHLNHFILPLDLTADAIVHLAGKAHDLKKISNPKEYYDVNFELTKKLYDAFLKSSAQKFIFLSSVKAVADHVNYVLTEESVANPKTHYGKSKLLAEQYIQEQLLPHGKSFYILRPCMIHGPGNKGNLNLLYQFVKKGIPYPLASFENKRSFLSVENLCFIIKELIEIDDVASGVYHIADDKPLSTNEVISVLSTSMNIKPKLWHVPVSIMKTAAKIGDLLGLPLNTERLNKLTESFIVSNEKLKSALQVELPLSSKAGLEITANSFIRN